MTAIGGSTPSRRLPLEATQSRPDPQFLPELAWECGRYETAGYLQDLNLDTGECVLILDIDQPANPEAAGEDELSISVRRLSPPYSDDCNWQVIVFVETKYAEALQRAIDAARAEYTLDGSFPGQSAAPRA